jgi:hypothetical protein
LESFSLELLPFWGRVYIGWPANVYLEVHFLVYSTLVTASIVPVLHHATRTLQTLVFGTSTDGDQKYDSTILCSD